MADFYCLNSEHKLREIPCTILIENLEILSENSIVNRVITQTWISWNLLWTLCRGLPATHAIQLIHWLAYFADCNQHSHNAAQKEVASLRAWRGAAGRATKWCWVHMATILGERELLLWHNLDGSSHLRQPLHSTCRRTKGREGASARARAVWLARFSVRTWRSSTAERIRNA